MKRILPKLRTPNYNLLRPTIMFIPTNVQILVNQIISSVKKKSFKKMNAFEYIQRSNMLAVVLTYGTSTSSGTQTFRY